MRARQTDGLLDLGESIRRAVDPLALIQRVVDQLLESVAAADGVLLGLTVGADSLRFVCGAGLLARQVGERLALEGSLVGMAIASGETLLSEDTERDERVNRNATRAFGVRSSVCVPLRAEEPLGVLCVSCSRPEAFAARDVAALDGLADFLTAVIAAACQFTTAIGHPLGARCGADAGSAEIERIVRERRFGVMLQPIFALRDGSLLGAEALARFPDAPALRPDAMIARAHEAGLGVELELAILEAALTSIGTLPDGALLTLNAGPQVIACERIGAVLGAADSTRLVVELTEHAAVGDYPGLTAALQRLRHMGVRVAIDDAGAGFASLMHILKLAPEIIKLDRELIAGIDIDPVRRSLAASLLRFSHETGAVIVAEGVETAAELGVLHDLGIDHAQGFHLARPVPPEALRGAARDGGARVRAHFRGADEPVRAIALAARRAAAGAPATRRELPARPV